MSSIASLLKVSLTNSLATIYTCTHSVETATSIAVCNTSASAVTLFLYFVPNGSSQPTGAIFSGSSIDANSTVILSERYMQVGDTIQAYAGTTGVIQFSSDILY